MKAASENRISARGAERAPVKAKSATAATSAHERRAAQESLQGAEADLPPGEQRPDPVNSTSRIASGVV